MQFLNPAALFGLIAALIPLAIHLLHRGRSRPAPFSNLRFLQRLHHNRMRQVRLRQWLVLLLRTLVIALLVCAFARPAYRGGDGWGGSAPPVAGVILLDRSASTACRVPGGTVFGRLRQQALQLAALFQARDRLVVIPFDEQPQAVVGETEGEHLEARLRDVAPGPAATDLQAALRAAAQQLSRWPDRDREVFLLTDLTAHDWARLEAPRGFLGSTRVFVSAPDDADPTNVHVDRIWAPSWMPAAGSPLTVQVRLANGAVRAAGPVDVDLFLDGERVAQRAVSLGPREEATAALVATPRRPGRLAGFAELAQDDLPEDNRRYVVVGVPDQIDVLLLGSGPDDTYYPRRALAAAAAGDPALRFRAGLVSELDAAALQGVEVLVLCNLQRLSSVPTQLVQSFVGAGGGLVLFPGPQADVSYLNRELLPPLVPAVVQGLAGRPGDTAGGLALDSASVQRPLFDDLMAALPQDQPRFAASFALAPAQGVQVLAQFTDGRVAACSGWHDRGRTVLLAFPLTLEWTNLPLKGLFAPLLHRLVRELSVPADRQAEYLVGQSAQRFLRGVPVSAQVRAESPSGAQQLLEAQPDGERYVWRVPRLGEAGIWRVWHEGREVDAFAVNLNPVESDLTRASSRDVERILGAEHTFLLPTQGDLRAAVLQQRYGREIWRELLALALALLMVELWVARAPHKGNAARSTGQRSSHARSDSNE